VDRNGEIKTRFARRWLRKYPSDFGESCLAVSVALEDVRDAVEIADHVIGLMPYRGVFSVEFKEGATDGRYRVLEVNARPWWYVGFTCEAGVDVCEMTYRDALEQPVGEVRSYREGLYVVYPELHWQANRLLPAGEREGTLAMLRRWASAVQPIFSWSDPGPWAAGWKKRLQRKLAAAGVRRSIVVPIESSSSEAHGE
jgi:predicted ATP-grasp superfamily ATP-dependent carboligase